MLFVALGKLPGERTGRVSQSTEQLELAQGHPADDTRLLHLLSENIECAVENRRLRAKLTRLSSAADLPPSPPVPSLRRAAGVDDEESSDASSRGSADETLMWCSHEEWGKGRMLQPPHCSDVHKPMFGHGVQPHRDEEVGGTGTEGEKSGSVLLALTAK